MATVDVDTLPWAPILVALALGAVTLVFFVSLNSKMSSGVPTETKTAGEVVVEKEMIELTEEELRAYDGKQKNEVYIAVKDPYGDEITIFNMEKGRDFYGPGGPYELFAGRHASHGLAKSSVDMDLVTGDLSKLSASEMDTLQGWYLKYVSKYPKIGVLKVAE